MRHGLASSPRLTGEEIADSEELEKTTYVCSRRETGGSDGTARLQAGTVKVRAMERKRRVLTSDIELRLEGTPMFWCLLAKTKPARLPRVHDVSVPQISLIDRESGAVPRATLVNPTSRKAACPIQERARKHDIAARAGAMAITDPSRETLFNVAGSEVHQIQTPHLAPKENAALFPTQRPKPLPTAMLVDARPFVEYLHGGGILGQPARSRQPGF